MSRITVCGVGVVSPAGWGLTAFREAVAASQPLPVKLTERPGWSQVTPIRPVPAPSTRPEVFGHGRLRRSSPVSRFAVAAALEALTDAREPHPFDGPGSTTASAPRETLGIILCVMAGCVNYTRRFYGETLKDPATASPLVFPETVFNAPASHIASVLGATGMNYTLVGDSGTFLVGLALAATWLSEKQVDSCLVIGAEELDWLTSDSWRLFSDDVVPSEGAGALYLRADTTVASAITIESISDPHLYTKAMDKTAAAKAVRSQMPSFCPTHLLCDSRLDHPRLDTAEREAWADWTGTRISPKAVLGESLAAGGAWQCVTAIEALRQKQCTAATVSVVGCNEQAIAAHFAAAG